MKIHFATQTEKWQIEVLTKLNAKHRLLSYHYLKMANFDLKRYIQQVTFIKENIQNGN